jgi:hypothetical protein
MCIWDADSQMGHTQKCNSNGREYQKTVALVVLALTKLHNYCINCNDSDAPSATPSDAWRSELNGTVQLVATTEH